ncbi:rhomboid family intramembrane serine protease [bacterium]|nr:rhomboid family intramembrane serine protease [bacterium]
MARQSDSQLARSALFNLPWLTLGIVFVQVVCFVFSSLSATEASFFALQAIDDSQLRTWGFDLSHPLRNAGLNVLSSFFIHSGWGHFISNLSMSFLVLFLAERSHSKRTILLYLLLGHLLGLIGAYVAYLSLSQPTIVVGMSAGIFAVAAAVLKARFGRTAYAVSCLLAFIYSYADFAGFTAHVFAILLGLAGNTQKIRQLQS